MTNCWLLCLSIESAYHLFVKGKSFDKRNGSRRISNQCLNLCCSRWRRKDFGTLLPRSGYAMHVM